MFSMIDKNVSMLNDVSDEVYSKMLSILYMPVYTRAIVSILYMPGINQDEDFL